ncbi:hypothetical protein [Jeongeupia sp. HS-3]|uniref:hypothetical protein n=1 Tax=Jeongeupia sp. HS-3 TaxID=1009682 RepID=UPI00191051E7|nr:hypothetical protein [Jeongeupia sp. HS-3]
MQIGIKASSKIALLGRAGERPFAADFCCLAGATAKRQNQESSIRAGLRGNGITAF